MAKAVSEDTGPKDRSAIAIVDAHQHFWDLSRGAHPWLVGKPLESFRYGDYSAIRRSYLPADFRRDSAGQFLIGSVHVEAEWDPADPLAETQWLTDLREIGGLPTAIVGQAWFCRADIADILAGQAKNPLVRGDKWQSPSRNPGAHRLELPDGVLLTLKTLPWVKVLSILPQRVSAFNC